MKSHPYLGWGLVAALLTISIIFVIYQYVEVELWLAYLTAFNVATFLLYWYDKLVAGPEDADRIPSWLLLAFAAVGGSVGAAFGIYLVDHKTGAKYLWLRLVFWMIVVAQAVLTYCIAFDQSGRCPALWDEFLW